MAVNARVLFTCAVGNRGRYLGCSHLTKLEKEGRVSVHAGKRRERPADEIVREEEQEHARVDVIRRAEEYREETRRRALFRQENPPTDEWAEPPRYEIEA